MAEPLSDRILAFRKYIDDWALRKLLDDCLELAQYVEAKEHRTDGITARHVWEWFSAQDIGLMDWQQKKLKALDPTLDR